jgi:Ca-activated chloride channel family protein
MASDSKTEVLYTDLDRTRIVSPPGQGERTLISSDKTLVGAGEQALAISALADNTHVSNKTFARCNVLFEIKSTGSLVHPSLQTNMNAGRGTRLPLNLALVIDRSGSMDGEPLEYAKRACGYVVDLLEPNDILSVITFEESAEVIMPARRVINKPLVKEYINRIYAGNTTNISDGLMQGCIQVSSVKSENSLNRVLLLTDGEPTAGIKDFSSIVSQVSEQKARGITVTALGFGPDYNEELLAGIARRSGGNYYHVSRPDLIPEVFRRELDTLMRITARNLRLRVLSQRGVQMRQVYGQQPSFGSRAAEVILPDVERESAISSLWQFELSPRPEGNFRTVRAELLYDDASTGRCERLVCEVVQTFTKDDSLILANVNRRVQAEVEVAEATRSLDRTIMTARTQQMDRTIVMAELERTKTLMMDRGMGAQAREITLAMNEIQSGGSVEKTLMGAVYQIDQGKSQLGPEGGSADSRK